MSLPGPSRPWVGLRDGFRTQLWPLPATAVLLAIVVGIGLPRLERTGVPTSLQSYLFSGGADAARTVLDAVAGSLITVTALTFSLTVVTLQLASSQFSPRLLRTFTRDLLVQTTLGLFLGTFAYTLTVLRTVRTASDSRSEFVPHISVTLAYVLAVASVVGLIFFLAHLAQTIRVESMLRSVHEDASTTMCRELAEADGLPVSVSSVVPSGPSTMLTAASSGFLVRVREDDLLLAAVDEDVVVVVDRCPGSSLVAGTPIGAVWSARAAGSSNVPHEVTQTLSRSLVTGFERTSVQDVSYGLRQITDVAVKALSPGINDPTTAIHALGHSSALLGEFARRDLGARVLRDEQGQVRVVLARPDFAALLRLALDQPARYGASDPSVLVRLFVLLRELAWVCAPHQHPAVRSELARLRRIVERQRFDEDDAAELSAAAQRVDLALPGSGPWTPAHDSHSAGSSSRLIARFRRPVDAWGGARVNLAN